MERKEYLITRHRKGKQPYSAIHLLSDLAKAEWGRCGYEVEETTTYKSCKECHKEYPAIKTSPDFCSVCLGNKKEIPKLIEEKLMIFTNEEWNYFCNKINWGASFLDARAIRIMNKPFNKKQDVDEI